MADGNSGATLARARRFARPSWISQFWFWLTATRSGLITVWAVLGFIAFAGVLFGEVFGPWTGLLASTEARTIFVGALALEVLPILLLFLDPTENLQNGPSLALPLLCLGLLALLTSVVVFDATVGGQEIFGSLAFTTQQLANRVAFFAYFAVAFVPSIWNSTNFAQYEESRRQQTARAHAARNKLDTEDDSEALGALIATSVAVVVGVLAYFAGRSSTPLAFENFYGLVLCGIVIGVFTIIAFLEALSETAWVQSMARTTQSFSHQFVFLARFYDGVDAGLARIGAGVAGMGQRRVVPRYVLLAGTLSCLSLMAWYLPSPLGLVAAFIGFVVAVSVSRLWAWVESDRSLAAMTEYKQDVPYRVGFREDFRDEAMLGFTFVFVLLPIAMMQAHVGQIFGQQLFDRAEGKSFLDWFGFFGVELAKAVPIVNLSEVYNVRDGDDVIGFSSPAAKHIVFLARVTIDMVLISALLQAIGIASRNRNQKRLFAAGHIRRFDELVEKTELNHAVRATYRKAEGGEPERYDLLQLGKNDVVDFRRYDETRLKTVYWATKDSKARGLIKCISDASAGKIELSTAMDLLRDIAATTKKPGEMTVAFERALEDNRKHIRIIDMEDLYDVLYELRGAQSLRGFKFQVIDQVLEIASPDRALTDLSDFAGGPLADYQYIRRKIASVVPDLVASINGTTVLQETLAKWQSWSHEDRPHGPEFSVAVKAMEDRLKLLRKKH